MARGLLDYLRDWSPKDESGDSRRNASGASTEGADPESGVPYRWDTPSPEYGIEKDGSYSGGYGHSDDCKDVGMKDTAWGMSRSEIEAGYERLKSDGEGGVLETRQPYGSFEQTLPTSNPHDRGAGSDHYAREHSEHTGRGFDGRGKDVSTSNPGGESMNTRPLPY